MPVNEVFILTNALPTMNHEVHYSKLFLQSFVREGGAPRRPNILPAEKVRASRRSALPNKVPGQSGAQKLICALINREAEFALVCRQTGRFNPFPRAARPFAPRMRDG